MPKDEIDKGTLIVVGIIVVLILWQYVIQPSIIWVQQNMFWIGICLVGVLGFIILGFYYNSKEQKKRVSEEKAEFERKEVKRKAFLESQKEKGLVLFTDRHGVEKWGNANEVNVWLEEDEEAKQKETLFFKVVESIKLFKPTKIWRNEFNYQLELQGWLKREFPSSKIEVQTGSSRPDIIIEDIAIEVKGPTDNQALDKLTTKCLKYSQYYNYIIMVLFEPSFSEGNYNEIKKGLKNKFPNVEFIRK